MVVDRLQDGLAHAQQLQVLLHDLDVVAVGVQRGERQRLALDAVIAVVVVHADRRDPLRPERRHQTLGDRGLAGGAVARDRQHDRSGDAAVGSARPMDVHLLRQWGSSSTWVSVSDGLARPSGVRRHCHSPMFLAGQGTYPSVVCASGPRARHHRRRGGGGSAFRRLPRAGQPSAHAERRPQLRQEGLASSWHGPFRWSAASPKAAPLLWGDRDRAVRDR